MPCVYKIVCWSHDERQIKIGQSWFTVEQDGSREFVRINGRIYWIGDLHATRDN